MRRSASTVAEAEPYRPELVSDDEPRYLRRQKPLEIRRKKFTGKTWPFYRRMLIWTATGAAVIFCGVVTARFFLYSPSMLLLKRDQIEVTGNHYVAREAVLDRFYVDRGHSVVRVPLEARRAEIEKLAWVESASVERILPNRIRVAITERTPIAFLRSGAQLALIDAQGVILDRPADQDFQFPIVSGTADNVPLEERARRMQTYQEFMKDADLVRSEASDHVSEVDLSNPRDLRAVMAGFPGATSSQAVTIHFGQGDFTPKFRMLVDNFAQWQANAGCVQSVDLQYSRQVVLNPDANACGGRTQMAQKGK